MVEQALEQIPDIKHQKLKHTFVRSVPQINRCLQLGNSNQQAECRAPLGESTREGGIGTRRVRFGRPRRRAA